MISCKDNTYYTGITSKLEERIEEHKDGLDSKSYTFPRRPLHLVYSLEFDHVKDAIGFEKQLKKWSKAKKEALINGDFDKLPNLARKKF